MEYIHLRIPHHQAEPVLNRLDDYFRTAKLDRWDAEDRYEIVGIWNSVAMTVEVMVRIHFDLRCKEHMMKHLSIQGA